MTSSKASKKFPNFVCYFMKYLNIIFSLTFATAILSGALLAVNSVYAGPPATPSDKAVDLGIEGLKKEAIGLNRSGLDTKNPQTAVAQTIGRVIGFFGRLMGTMALVMYVWAGTLWLTAAGAKEKIDTSIKIFIWTSLGVFAMLSTYVVVNIFFSDILWQ